MAERAEQVPVPVSASTRRAENLGATDVVGGNGREPGSPWAQWCWGCGGDVGCAVGQIAVGASISQPAPGYDVVTGEAGPAASGA